MRRDRRRAIHAVYAFCQKADQLMDLEPDTEGEVRARLEERRAERSSWRSCWRAGGAGCPRIPFSWPCWTPCSAWRFLPLFHALLDGLRWT